MSEGYQVRISPTSAGVDSRGVMKVPGLGIELEGSSYVLLLIGMMASVFLLLVLLACKVSTIVVVIGTCLPLGGCIAWHMMMVQGKPPAYSDDFFAKLIEGKDFFLRPLVWGRKPHPLGLAVRQKRHG